MEKNLAQEAISHALNANWKEAIKTNEIILKNDPQDIDALTRLARALAEIGNITEAKKTCQKVLEIDAYNVIAARSLEKWRGLKNAKGALLQQNGKTAGAKIPQIFLEEPGKTKITSLLYPGSRVVIAKLDSADEVTLDTHSHRVQVLTADGKYIGRLPDDLSARIKYLTAAGNEYQAFIKSINNQDVKIILRESRRSKKMQDVPSFPGERIDYVSFTPPEFVHKKAEIVVEKDSDETS